MPDPNIGLIFKGRHLFIYNQPPRKAMRRICSGLSVLYEDNENGEYGIRLNYDIDIETLKSHALTSNKEWNEHGTYDHYKHQTKFRFEKLMDIPSSGIYDIHMRLIHYGKAIHPTKIMAKVAKSKLYQGSIKELLAFAACFPFLSSQFPIAVFGENVIEIGLYDETECFAAVKVNGQKKYLAYQGVFPCTYIDKSCRVLGIKSRRRAENTNFDDHVINIPPAEDGLPGLIVSVLMFLGIIGLIIYIL